MTPDEIKNSVEKIVEMRKEIAREVEKLERLGNITLCDDVRTPLHLMNFDAMNKICSCYKGDIVFETDESFIYGINPKGDKVFLMLK